jgi:hypothetical protein
MVKMRTSENVAAVSKALVAAIGAMDGVRKDAQNSAFKANGKVSTYATLAACIEASRDVLSENKLCVIQGPGATNTEAKTLTITTRIIHESGEWIETDFDMPLTKWSPHEAGSATTYGRRFALMAMLGLAPVEDDDGNAAAGVKAEKMPNVSVQPEGRDWWESEGNGMTAAAAKRDGLGERLDAWLGEIPSLPTLDAWKAYARDIDDVVKTLPKGWRIMVREAMELRKAEL